MTCFRRTISTTSDREPSSRRSEQRRRHVQLFYSITDVTRDPRRWGHWRSAGLEYGRTATRAMSCACRCDGDLARRIECLEARVRIGANAQPLPAAWQFDTTAAFTIPTSGQSDGKVKFQYAPVSSEDIVAERRAMVIELDTTPPILTLPEPITVFADQTGGKVVSYAATAVDNLPGPVNFSVTFRRARCFPTERMRRSRRP